MGISKTYRGTAVSEGYGIGNAVVIKDEKLDYSDVAFTTPENECKRLDDAVSRYTEETKALIETLKKRRGRKTPKYLKGILLCLRIRL